mgnify:CR=1 FL=1
MCRDGADIAQSVERILGKDEVSGSNPDISSIASREYSRGFFMQKTAG